MIEKFWLVWRPTGSPPLHRHSTDREAIDEAIRLSRAYPNEEFFVLESIGFALTETNTWRPLR